MHVRTNLDYYLAEGLPPEAEARLRRHLRECERCRSYYDEQVVLLRAFAGAPDNPTTSETDRTVRLALRGAGLALPDETSIEGPSLLERILWVPRPALAAAVALLCLALGSGLWFLLSPGTWPGAGSMVAARLAKGRNLTLDGVRVDAGASPPLVVHAGQKIEVAKGGIAELTLESGGMVRVFPGSAMSLSGKGEGLDLASGKIWCLVEPEGTAFVVRTDTAEARVVGTSFVVERRRSGETEVRVMDGTVEVRNVHRKGTIRVESGKKTRVAPGRTPSPPRRYVPRRDRTDWDRFLREVLQGIQRAIKQAGELINGK